MTASRTPRRKRDNRPLRAVIVHQPGAPLREEDWTPDQEERAIQALATAFGILVNVDLTDADTETQDAA